CTAERRGSGAATFKLGHYPFDTGGAAHYKAPQFAKNRKQTFKASFLWQFQLAPKRLISP
ncbi:MAG TPA: hypothetical protein VGK40_11115, partial [Verrucomicrobiae bacterium]